MFLAFATTQEEHTNYGLTVSVIGGTVLPGPVQIWVSRYLLADSHCAVVSLISSHISLTLQQQEYSMFTRADGAGWIDLCGLDPNSQKSLHVLLDRDVSECMLVPIKRPDNHQLFLVVALVDKQEGLTFGSLDLQAVHQCFE